MRIQTDHPTQARTLDITKEDKETLMGDWFGEHIEENKDRTYKKCK